MVTRPTLKKSTLRLAVQPEIPVIPFTPKAFAAMEAEVAELQVERKAVMERLQTAREMGDLSENGAYHYAKFELGRIGRRLRQLNHLIANGRPVAVQPSAGVIGFGSTITLTNPKRSMTFMLVSEHESNPAENKLSLNSPIGQAVKDKKVGDQVTVSTPNGPVTYQITASK